MQFKHQQQQINDNINTNMKNNAKIIKANTTPGFNKTPPKDLLAKFAADAPHHNSGKESTDDTEGHIVCFGCYLGRTIQNTLEVIQNVKTLVSQKAEPETIDEGFDLVTSTLEKLLDQFDARQHGEDEDLPDGMIAVVGVPYVVNQQPQADMSPVKAA